MICHAALSVLDGVSHGFFTRRGGVSVGELASMNVGYGADDDADAVTENRRRAANALGFDEGALTTVRQIHSNLVALAAAPWDYEASPEGDALVTATPGVMLGILTADCAPVLFCDPKQGVIGAAHAGWKGAKGGVLEATVDAMAGLGANPADIIAVVGPCIAQVSYEVDGAFFDDFMGEQPDNARFFGASEKDGHYQFDLSGYVCGRLAETGVGTVSDVGEDTYADADRFYSYRRACHQGGNGYGRLLSAIGLHTR